MDEKPWIYVSTYRRTSLFNYFLAPDIPGVNKLFSKGKTQLAIFSLFLNNFVGTSHTHSFRGSVWLLSTPTGELQSCEVDHMRCYSLMKSESG